VWAALFLIGAAAYSAIAIFRHDRFGSAAFDLGVYDQQIWGYSHFRLLYNSVSLIPNLLGDHFHPILMVLAPIYWIWNDVRSLLIAQALLLALGSVPIFWWARQRLGLWPAALLQGAFLVFWGILAGDVFDFHQLAVAVPAVSFALYAAVTRNNLLLWPAAAVGMLSKEDVSLTFLFIGIYLIVAQRRWRVGLVLAAVSAVYFWVVIKIVIPAIRGGAAYGHWTYTALGATPEAAIKHLLLRPWDAILVAIRPFRKIELLGALLIPWLLLPLLSPIFIVAIPLIAERVWSDSPEFWSTHYHYSMVIATVLAFGTVDTIGRMQDRWPRLQTRRLAPAAAAAVLAAGLLVTFAAVRPLSELSHELTGGQAAAMQSCLTVIPADASVTATSLLVPHLTHRTDIFVLPYGIGRTTWVAVGPPNPGFGPSDIAVQAYIDQARAAGYQVRCSSGRLIMVLSR